MNSDNQCDSAIDKLADATVKDPNNVKFLLDIFGVVSIIIAIGIVVIVGIGVFNGNLSLHYK